MVAGRACEILHQPSKCHIPHWDHMPTAPTPYTPQLSKHCMRRSGGSVCSHLHARLEILTIHITCVACQHTMQFHQPPSLNSEPLRQGVLVIEAAMRAMITWMERSCCRCSRSTCMLRDLHQSLCSTGAQCHLQRRTVEASHQG